MKLEEAIVKRRAHYPIQFSGETVEDSVIERMLELANWAPTHRHTEPWRFQVFSGKSMDRFIDEINEIYIKHTASENFKPSFASKMTERKTSVSHIILISMQPDPEANLPEFEELSAVAMAVQNMWLFLSSLEGYGGYWSTPEILLGEDFHEKMSLDENERCLGMFYVGKLKDPLEEVKGHRSAWKEKVKWHKI